MTDVILTTYADSRVGVDLTGDETTVDPAKNYYMPNDGNTRLWVVNASGNPCTVTIHATATVDSLALVDPTVTVSTGKSFLIGPFPKAVYDNSSGQVKFNFSAIVNITAVRG